MGGWFSSDSKAEETKTVDSNGVINNTFVTNERLQIHNPEIILLLGIIAAVQLIQLGIYCYAQHIKSVKKKARGQGNQSV